MFLWYLRRDQDLLALPLLVAESLREQKTRTIRLIEHFVLLRQEA